MRYYQQAYRAVEAGEAVGEHGQTIFMYMEMAPYYVAQAVLKRNEIEAFRPESVRVLQEYDHDHGTDLVDTLAAYLAHVEDTVSAANDLHIHRNTLLYRINKIREITGIDFHSGDERFAIQLYFKFQEYQHASWTVRE